MSHKKNPAFGQNKVRADIFSDSLAVFQSERVASPPEADRCGGRKRGLGEIPPALQILGEISSYFFESTPPIGKWSTLRQHPPANFGFKSEFFTLFRLMSERQKRDFKP